MRNKMRIFAVYTESAFLINWIFVCILRIFCFWQG